MPCNSDGYPDTTKSDLASARREIKAIGSYLCAICSELSKVYDQSTMIEFIKQAETNSAATGLAAYVVKHQASDEARLAKKADSNPQIKYAAVYCDIETLRSTGLSEHEINLLIGMYSKAAYK